MDIVSQRREAHPAVDRPFPARKRVLLIVDDDEGPRRSLEVVFQNEFRVLLAENGTEALEYVKQYPVDAAILDIRMTGMSGIELLERLKSMDPAIEAIMLTGYESMETIRQALRLGACDYLSKPFDIETIRGAVANAMERRSLSQEISSTHQKMTALQVELQQQAVREQITRNKGEIYGSILHDINGPLTIIAGYIQLLDIDLESLPRANGPDMQGVKDHIRQINRQVNHCIEISQRYLGFLRRKPSEKTAVYINKSFEDLKALLKAHPARQGHQLQIEELENDPIAAMNGADFIQILLNLAINAFQSTPEPHLVKITGSIIADSVDFSTLADDPSSHVLLWQKNELRPPFVRIRVEDTGPGIRPEILTKIFEPYFSTKADKGTGLGLSIVQRLISEAGGVIHVQSEVGKGTAFSLYLRLESSL
jgi:two-component system, sensor histidine kinase and response regulator